MSVVFWGIRQKKKTSKPKFSTINGITNSQKYAYGSSLHACKYNLHMAPCITSISALKMVALIMVCLQRRLLTKIGTVLQQMHALLE